MDIDCQRSYVVGDTADDLKAAVTIGAKSCFVLTGWASKYAETFGHEANFIGADLLAVAEWILSDAQPAG